MFLESNKSRLNFELTLQDALHKYQHMASERVYLVQSNCRNFIKLHEDFCEKFNNTSARFKTSVSKVDVQQEVNRFVQMTTAKSKQVRQKNIALRLNLSYLQRKNRVFGAYLIIKACSEFCRTSQNIGPMPTKNTLRLNVYLFFREKLGV